MDSLLEWACRHLLHHLLFRKLSLLILVWCLVSTVQCVAGIRNDTDYTVHTLGSSNTSFTLNNDWNVKKKWGVPDTTAYVGKLFKHHIPADAFIGNVHHIEVLTYFVTSVFIASLPIHGICA